MVEKNFMEIENKTAKRKITLFIKKIFLRESLQAISKS